MEGDGFRAMEKGEIRSGVLNEPGLPWGRNLGVWLMSGRVEFAIYSSCYLQFFFFLEYTATYK